MRRLVLIRHANATLVSGVPPAEWKLSETGVRRARDLADRVRPGTARVIYSSTERKAVETAQLLGEAWTLPVTRVDGLHEHERAAEPLVAPHAFESRARECFARPDDLVFGMETARQAQRRFERAVNTLLTATSGDVLVVTHGTVMTLFVAAATGLEPFVFWQSLDLPCAVALSLPSLAIEGITTL